MLSDHLSPGAFDTSYCDIRMELHGMDFFLMKDMSNIFASAFIYLSVCQIHYFHYK